MLETVRKIIKQSNKIVFMTGLGSVVECGGRDLWSSDIFYDIEDDNMMSQTLLLKDGSTIFGKSRNHEEVSKWEARGIKINKSYGY